MAAQASRPDLEKTSFGELPIKIDSYGSSVKAVPQESSHASEDDPRLLPESVNGHYPCLDITRIICIFLVVVDHAGTTFGTWNVMYVQAWVLQYLYLICGICYGMSSRSTLSYVSRLIYYFCIGVTCNWIAYKIKGLDWKSDWWNVVFQFWFIVGLIGFIAAVAPLKSFLKRVQRQDRHDGLSLLPCVAMLTGGCVTIKLVFAFVMVPTMQYLASGPLAVGVQSLGPGASFWGLPATPTEADEFLESFLSYIMLSVTNIFIVLAMPSMSSELSMTGWVVILNTYAHRCVQYRGPEARMINGFDMVMLGLVCYYCGLSHRRVIGEYLVRYWFVFLFCCALLWPPGTSGRFDEHPPLELDVRVKDNLLEMAFVVLLLTSIERIIDPKIFTKDGLQFLGHWSLLLFLVHKAVHIVVPVPFNWLILMGLAPICYVALTSAKSRVP